MKLFVKSEADQSQLTDAEMRKGIWGPWFWFASVSGLLFPIPKNANAFKMFLLFIPNLFLGVVFAVRAAYLLYVMSRARGVTFNWAYSVVLFVLSIHGFVCVLTLSWYKYDRFFVKMIAHIRQSAVDKFVKVPIITLLIQLLVLVILCFTPYTLYIADSFILAKRHRPNNGTNLVGIYGNTLGLYIADAVIVAITAYVTSIAFITYFLANSAVLRQYEVYLEKLKKQVNDCTLSKLENLKIAESQLINFLSAVCYLNTINSWLLIVSFVAGIVVQISAQMATQTYRSKMSTLENVLFAFWIVQAIIFMLFSMKRPGSVQNQLTATKDLLWLNHDIWSDSLDLQVMEITENMIHKIETIDYPVKSMAQIGNTTVHFILIIIPLLVDILAGTGRLQIHTGNQ